MSSFEDPFENIVIQLRSCHQEQTKQLQHQLFDYKKKYEATSAQLEQANQTIAMLEKKLEESNEARNLVYKKYLDVQKNHDDLSTFKKSIVNMLDSSVGASGGIVGPSSIASLSSLIPSTVSSVSSDPSLASLSNLSLNHNSHNKSALPRGTNNTASYHQNGGASTNYLSMNNNSVRLDGSGSHQQTISSLTAGVADILEKYERDEKLISRRRDDSFKGTGDSLLRRSMLMEPGSVAKKPDSKFSLDDILSPVPKRKTDSSNSYLERTSRLGPAERGLHQVPQEKIEEVREELAHMTAEQLYNQTKQRLSGLEFADFARNIKRLNQQEQSVEETLKNVKQIFGNDKQHLFSQFQRLIRRGEA